MTCFPRVTLLTLLILGLMSAAVPVRGFAGEMRLDESSFSGQTGKKGEKKGEADEFYFKDGRFRSKFGEGLGFGEAEYTSASSETAVNFESAAGSLKNGLMKWKGTVRENRIKGRMLWYRRGEAPVEYWFKGRKKE